MPDTDQDRPPIVLTNTNERGISLTDLFPRLTSETVEFWRQQDAAEQALADELRRRFAEEQAKARF